MNYEAGGIAFVGCLLVGVGIGMLVDQPGPGSIIGIGVGFLVMAILGRK